MRTAGWFGWTMLAPGLRRGKTMHATAKAVALLTLVLLAGVGCQDEIGPDPASPLRDAIPGLLVSNAVPVAGSTACVSIRPGSLPQGLTATIAGPGGGEPRTVPVVAGGLDPVPVPAAAGDVISIAVDTGGTEPVR